MARRICPDCGARIPASHPRNPPATLPAPAVEPAGLALPTPAMKDLSQA
jgi:hypothetical protein